MTELLLELMSEEIPARMQARAAADLGELAGAALREAELPPAEIATFATPRRLTLVVRGVPARQPDLEIEKRGPRVGAPPAASRASSIPWAVSTTGSKSATTRRAGCTSPATVVPASRRAR